MNNNQPRLYGIDVPLTNLTSAVTSIVLTWNPNNDSRAHAAVFALSGVVTEPGALAIIRAGGQTKLDWSFGTLLDAPQIHGPWTTNRAALPPFLIQPSSPSRFHRLQME